MDRYEDGTPQQVVHELWQRLNRRPLESEIVAALKSAGLAHSRQQAQRVRERVRSDSPSLPYATKYEAALEAVRRMAGEGASDSDIGRAVGMSARAVFNVRKRNGVSSSFRFTPQHGSPSAYKKGCRCSECRAGRAQRAQKQREGRARRRLRSEAAEDSFTHGLAAYTNWGCRCAVCTAEHSAACKGVSQRWRERNPEEANERSRQSFAKAQAETLGRATRHYWQWTGPELELAARPDLSARQVALLIGRTAAAVVAARRRLKEDPQAINVAGIAKGGPAASPS